METLIDRLRKIEALASSGSEGERDNAQRLLDQLCRKYGVSPDQIASSDLHWYSFAAATKIERDLLGQVIVHVLQTVQIRNKKTAKGIQCQLTAAQAIDVRDCWEHFRTVWRTQLGDFFQAFIHNNRIYGPRSDKSGEVDEATKAQAKRIFDMMQGIAAQPWEKRLRLPST